ncbi:MAG TPA: FixH family protein [Burkholderiales bacterium]|nr:FixH family protein [Burkholderiales bacterium]
MAPINAEQTTKPWYKEPWPWILISGPFIVVVAGFFTLWLAIHTDDGVVTEDYYQKGLAINQTLKRDEFAAAHHYRATLLISPEHAGVRVFLSGDGPLPASIRMRISHTSRSGEEQVISLRSIGAGTYEGRLGSYGSGRHLLVLEDNSATWRLSAWWDPAPQDQTLAATPE